MPFTLANPTEDVADPFQDLVPDNASPELTGGGTPAAPAYQTVNGQTTEVPKAIAAQFESDNVGPFSDLVQTTNPRPVDNYEQEFGQFHDLVPRSETPETDAVMGELQSRLDREMQPPAPRRSHFGRVDSSIEEMAPAEAHPMALQPGQQYEEFSQAMMRPAVDLAPYPIANDDSEAMKISKTMANITRGFISGATSPVGALALLNPWIAGATIAAQTPHVIERLKEADKTPSLSPERHMAAAEVVTTLLPFAMHAAARSAGAEPVRPVSASEPAAAVMPPTEPSLRTEMARVAEVKPVLQPTEGGELNAAKEGNIQENVRVQPEDRVTGGQTETPSVSDRLQSAAPVEEAQPVISSTTPAEAKPRPAEGGGGNESPAERSVTIEDIFGKQSEQQGRAILTTTSGGKFRGSTIEEALENARKAIAPEMTTAEFIKIGKETEPDFYMTLDGKDVLGLKRRRVGQSPDDFGSELTPVSQYVIDSGGVMSKTTAGKNGLLKKNADLWDGQPEKLADPTHNKVFKEGGGLTPDKLASMAYDEGLISDPYPDTLWKAINSESRSAKKVRGEQREQLRQEKANAPKLRSGEKQGDLLQGSDQPFNLAGEKGIDFAARQAESERIARESEIAKAEQEGQQSKLFDVPEQLKTPEPVRKLLEEERVRPKLSTPEAPPEGGALFGKGGKRAGTKPIGVTPLGDPNWLRIPSWVKRAGRGLMTEGARGVLGRTKNEVGKALAKATRQHVDIEQELFGMHDKMLREAVSKVPRKRLDSAFTEVSQYIRDVENGRTPTPLAADAKGLLDAWYKVGKSTGDIARANNVQVREPNGQYRPMGTVKDYIPRMFRSEVETVLRDPDRNPALFNQLAQDIANHRNVPLADAAKELRQVSGRFASNDHMSNLEMARTSQLPESFYEYDLRNLASRYLPSFSERMGQIIAYGQRLGSKEAPQQANLWDIARREAQDADTQQWLNDAEDQATGFHPRSSINRNARRAQAIGNAFLLSDPTTTVVRNLLSGLSVTTERYGIGRSLKQMVNAGRTASRMDTRELGAIRDDIGNFLGAEQLGDRKLDSFIRTLQNKALTVSGFSGSETFVRSHNAAVASQFARDAARALDSKPRSALSREALAQFKRLDVDPEKIVAERGEWKTGPETRKFIRSSIRESQGGYRFDQVPLWAGTTAGRFLYQYGRWAIQRAGDIFRNTIRPAIGESVEFRGQRMTRRNVLPLMRLGLFTVGLGETFAGIANVLFDRDRKDASLEEIGQAFNEDESKAVLMLGERMVNDMITAGTLGLLGQPLDFIKATKDQSRFKNPAEPPSLFGVKALIDLAQKAYDQGGSLTKRDWLDAAGAVIRGPKNLFDIARSKFGNQLYESQNDQRTLRNAARRWAKEQGMDIAPPALGDFRKSPNAPVFESINEALLRGDADAARQEAIDFIDKAKDKDKAAKAVRSSVESKHPFRAGNFSAQKYQDAFLGWADTHLSKADLEQVKRVITIYDQTAKEAGLD